MVNAPSHQTLALARVLSFPSFVEVFGCDPGKGRGSRGETICFLLRGMLDSIQAMVGEVQAAAAGEGMGIGLEGGKGTSMLRELGMDYMGFGGAREWIGAIGCAHEG